MVFSLNRGLLGLSAASGALLAAGAGCSSSPKTTPPDGAAQVAVTITASNVSTRFVTREHFIAAGEMQLSGEPLAEAMQRDLANYSRDHIPSDIYFDTSPLSAGPWIDVAGFSTAVESYEYSKQPMNNVGFESGAGTSLVFGPINNPGGATGSDALALAVPRVQHFAIGSNATSRFVVPVDGTDPSNRLGWPGLWPVTHVFADFDPSINATGDSTLNCSISSDDDPGASGSLASADYECDYNSLHLPNRSSQINATVTPGADGFTGWKFGLWVLNYLQVMHDSNEAAVSTVGPSDLADVGSQGNSIIGADDSGAPTAAGTFLGSSDIEGFQAQLFVDEMDNRAEDWISNLTTTDGVALSGFASILEATQYSYTTPLRWFPGKVAVTEAVDSSGFPVPSYALSSANSDLLDLIGLALGYAEFYSLTDTNNTDVGGAQPALAYFDGDPFAADNQLADGEATLHDRALAVMRVAMIDLDRLHTDPASGYLVDDVTMNGATPTRGTTVGTTSVAYCILGLRTVLRSLSSQLELYSNNTPDTAIGTTPLDAVNLPINFPAMPSLTFTQRLSAMERSQIDLLYTHLTDATGKAFDGWNFSTSAPVDDMDLLDSHTAAVRGLFAAYLATGETKYRDRAIAVFNRIEAVFYDSDARIYSATPAPVDSVEFTPLRFALLQSTLRDMFELVAANPGGEALVFELEERLGRLDKLVLNGWDDRNQNRLVDWPDECVNVVDTLPRGGLQMAERTLTGETGSLQDVLMPGQTRTPTSDREKDCVPEIDDAKLPAALADSITFNIARQ